MNSKPFSNFSAAGSAILSCLLAVAGAGLPSASAQTAASAAESKAIADSIERSAVPSGAPAPKPILLLAQAGPTTQASPASSSSQTANTASPTYLGNVLPIIMRRCSRCHNEQARFVYNWLDYSTARQDRGEIARRVWDSWKGTYFKESMPIDNSPESLAITPEERAIIRSWVKAGASKGVPPPPNAPKTRTEKMELGRQLFTSLCAACHQPTGRGIPNVFPPLAGSDYLNADKNRAIKIVINGRQGEITVNNQRFNNSMPKFPLTDDDIANALTYVYNSFGNSGVEVTAKEVEFLRTQPPDVEGPSAPPPKNPFE